MREDGSEKRSKFAQSAVWPSVDLHALLPDGSRQKRGVIGNVCGICWRGDTEFPRIEWTRLTPEKSEEEGRSCCAIDVAACLRLKRHCGCLVLSLILYHAACGVSCRGGDQLEVFGDGSVKLLMQAGALQVSSKFDAACELCALKRTPLRCIHIFRALRVHSDLSHPELRV